MGSLATSAAAPGTSSSACSTADFTKFPTTDVACAVGSTAGINSSYSDVLKDCCKSAPVKPFPNIASDCGLYCLSVDQTIADLQKCWQDGGVSPVLIFCSGNNTATATGKPSDTVSETQAGSTAEQTGAAPGVGVPMRGLTKAGTSVVALLMVSAVFGMLL